MKKLITICLLLVTVFTVNAQDVKPTKEETISLINSITALSIGKQYGNKEIIITENKLFNDSYSYNIKLPEDIIFKETYSDIPWETLYTEDISLSKNDYFPSLGQVSFLFEKKFKIERARTGKETKIDETPGFDIVIPIEKYEIIKKAFLRLVAIAKEESFDPTVKYINNKIICCSEQKISTIKATLSGDISWNVGGRLTQINIFDLRATKGLYGTTTILEDEGIRLFKIYSNYVISFQVDNDNVEYLHEFRSQADAERVYRALVHLRSLCTKEKDPFDK